MLLEWLEMRLEFFIRIARIVVRMTIQIISNYYSTLLLELLELLLETLELLFELLLELLDMLLVLLFELSELRLE